jgi:uncharacterized protein (TIGR03067 family)
VKRLILSILAVFAIATVAVGCGGNTSSSGNTELQGTWKSTTTDKTATITFTFSGNNFTSTLISTVASVPSMQESGTFTLDPTANPKTIDLYLATSTLPSASDVGKTELGIYQLSGTSLKLYLRSSGDARPTVFPNDSLIFVKQ